MKICGIRPRSLFTTLLSLFAVAIIGSLCLFGCGSASNTYSPIAKTGGVQPGFTVSVGPSSVSVVAGNTANYTVTITEVGGFNSPITLSASNLPSGTTATFGDLTPTAGGATATLAIATTVELAAADIAAGKLAKSASKAATTRIVGSGTTTFTVSAVGGGITQTATAIISITGAPDFSITLTPATVTMPSNSTANYIVTLTSFGGFDVSSVTLSAPKGASTVTTAAYGTPTKTATGETVPLTIQLVLDDATPAGNYTITVSGAGSGITHAASAALDVTDYSITVSPGTASTTTGSSIQFKVTVTSLNGFSSPVTLSAGSLPTGAAGTFTSSTVTPTAAGVSTTLTITSSPVTTPFGPDILSVTGTSGSDVHVTFADLTFTEG